MIQQEDVDRYSKLFVSIIVLAVQDAGIAPTQNEKSRKQNMHPDAVSALEYLFGYDSDVFAKHAALIGADAEHIRRSLLCRDQPLGMQSASVSPEKLRTLRIRYRWMQRSAMDREQRMSKAMRLS